jgi:hypothetical protein
MSLNMAPVIGERYVFGPIRVRPGATRRLRQRVTQAAFRAIYLTVDDGFECLINDVVIVESQLVQPVSANVFRPAKWDPICKGTSDLVALYPIDLPSAKRGQLLTLVVSNPTAQVLSFKARLNGVGTESV